jgi:hypothetical protein
MQDHAFMFLVGAALASIILSAASAVSGNVLVALYMGALAAIALLGVLVARAAELWRESRP